MVYHATCQGHHRTAAEARSCAGVGYGGEQLTFAKPAAGEELATDRQAAFIRTLLGERFELGDPYVAETTRLLDDEAISKKRASELIGALLRMPKLERETPPESAPTQDPDDAPAGKYALEGADGVVRFYKIDRPTEGRWKGYVFTKGLLGAPGGWNEQKLSRAVATSILREISKDPHAAAVLFGRKHETCGQCDSPLSNIQSRAAGYGEICAGNRGWHYPSVSEAQQILGELEIKE